MNLLQCQGQAQVQRDGLGESIFSVTPGSFSSNLSSPELRTLHDEIETSGSQDPEKGAIELTGKYAKYAGEPPDGGLKAWSVILACVGYRFLQSVSGADRNDCGSCVQDWFDYFCSVGGFWFACGSCVSANFL